MTSQQKTGTHDSAPPYLGRQSGGYSPAARLRLPHRQGAEPRRKPLSLSPGACPSGGGTPDRRASIMLGPIMIQNMTECQSKTAKTLYFAGKDPAEARPGPALLRNYPSGGTTSLVMMMPLSSSKSTVLTMLFRPTRISWEPILELTISLMLASTVQTMS